MQADALAPCGVSDPLVPIMILFCIYVRYSVMRPPARLRRGFPAYPGLLLCSTTLRLVPTLLRSEVSFYRDLWRLLSC